MLILPRFFGVKWVYFGSTMIDVVIAFVTVVMFALAFKRLRRGEQTVTPVIEISSAAE